MTVDERIIAASTTDSMGDIAKALGVDAPAEDAKPVVETPAPAADPAPAKASDEEDPEPETEERPQRRRKPGVQDRIDQLTAENRKRAFAERSLSEENEALRRKLEQREQRSTAPAAAAAEDEAPKAKAEDPDRPKQENFDSYEEFVEALTDYKVTKRLADRDANEAKTRAEQRAAAEQAQFEAQLDEASTAYPDFHEVLDAGRDLPVTASMKEAIKISPVSGHLMYFLNRNADLCVSLSRMHPAVAVKEIGRIESAIFRARRQQTDEAPSRSDAPPARTAAQEAPQRQVSKAPAPPPSVRSGGSHSGLPKDLGQIKTLAEWEAARDSSGAGR